MPHTDVVKIQCINICIVFIVINTYCNTVPIIIIFFLLLYLNLGKPENPYHVI